MTSIVMTEPVLVPRSRGRVDARIVRRLVR
jgi:hypothetical protein